MSQPTDAQVESLRRELESLHDQLASERVARNARRRRAAGRALTVLAALATTLALVGVWTFRTLTDTDLFVARVGPVIERPEVAAAVGQAAASQLVHGIQLEQRLRDSLPPQISAVAAPLSSAAEIRLAQGATQLMQTERFQAAWYAALANGHRVSIAILSGQGTEALRTTGGVIVLDLTPVVNQVLTEGSQLVSDVLGREIGAPTVTADTVDGAVTALEDRLGVSLPADFGQVEVFASEDLTSAQDAYRAMTVSVWLAPLVALALAALAIAVAPRRLRTALGIVVGTGLLLLLVGLAMPPLRTSITNAVADEGLAGAVSAGFDTVLASLRTGIQLVVVLAAVAAIALYLTGAAGGAAAARRGFARTPELAARHRQAFLGGGAVVALVALAAIPGRSWGQLLSVLLGYAVFALAVLLAPRQVDPADPHTSGEVGDAVEVPAGPAPTEPSGG